MSWAVGRGLAFHHTPMMVVKVRALRLSCARSVPYFLYGIHLTMAAGQDVTSTTTPERDLKTYTAEAPFILESVCVPSFDRRIEL